MAKSRRGATYTSNLCLRPSSVKNPARWGAHRGPRLRSTAYRSTGRRVFPQSRSSLSHTLREAVHSVTRVPDRRALLLYLALAVVVLGLGVRQLRSGGDEELEPVTRETPVAAPRVSSGAGDRRVVVHVTGRVRRPGVYRLRAGARVDDAVRRAGGVRADADLVAVNLAAEVEDGRQIVVPARASATTPPAAGAGTVTTPAAPVNLNTATPEQLQELDGVGPGIAAKILAYRQEHGGFGSVKELGDVPGIGEKRLAALEASVTV